MTKMDSGLQNPENWNVDQAVMRPGSKKARAVVSVAFNRNDFELVVEAARRSQAKTSEFIREAALDKASTLAKVTNFRWVGGSLHSAVFVQTQPSTGTSSHSRNIVENIEPVLSS